MPSAVLSRPRAPATAARIGAWARACLEREIRCWPKPGLVSPVDSGSHRDMDAALLLRSAEVLEPWFADLAEAGRAGGDLAALRAIGRAAEQAMLRATGGVNTHRGAIFGLGLLCAAAGADDAGACLGETVRHRWGADLRAAPLSPESNGGRVVRRHGVAGARGEAAAGFPSVYAIGLPALHRGRRGTPDDADAPLVEALFALVAGIDDTNLLHRGGAPGLAFAQAQAQRFLAEGGVARSDWRARAMAIHTAFVARNLSPGGAADLLALTLFVEAWDGSDPEAPA